LATEVALFGKIRLKMRFTDTALYCPNLANFYAYNYKLHNDETFQTGAM